MNYSDILKSVKTIGLARNLLSEIDILLDSLFKTQNAFEEALNSISIFASQTLKSALAELTDNISFENKSIIKEYLIGFKNQLQKLKILKLSIAFEPSEFTIENLYEWVLKNLGNGVVLDIKTDKSILGGTKIEFEGKYKDFSLRKALEEVFTSKREEIMKPIRT